MRNKTLRKISVLLLSLTMVMTSMNLSFAENIISEEQQDQGKKVEQQGEVTPPTEGSEAGELESVEEETTIDEEQPNAVMQAPKLALTANDELPDIPESDMPTGNTVTYSGQQQTVFQGIKTYNANKNSPTTTEGYIYQLDNGDWELYSSSPLIRKTDAGEYTLRCKRVVLEKKTTGIWLN